MSRVCPKCDRKLAASAIRCECGHALPEARDARSDPDQPRCGVCGKPMEFMAHKCPSCDADGYPALRPRLGRKSQRAGDEDILRKQRF